MKLLTNSQLLISLSPQPAVRITTEINSLKDFELLNATMDVVRDSSWNRSRLLLEYRGGQRTDVHRLHRDIMGTYKQMFARPYTVFGRELRNG
jgi:hypothetical protein